MRDDNKQAYRFIEKALSKGPSLEAAPNAKHPRDAVRDAILFAATTQNTIETAVAILKDRGRDAPSPDVVFNRIRNTNPEDLVLLFTPCLEKVFAEAKRRRRFMGPKRVAIDIHEKPFYGEADGTIRGRARCGTTRFWAYVTLDILQEKVRAMDYILEELSRAPPEEQSKPESMKLREAAKVYSSFMHALMEVLDEFTESFEERLKTLEAELMRDDL